MKQKTGIAKNFSDIGITEIILDEGPEQVCSILPDSSPSPNIKPVVVNKHKTWTEFEPVDKESKERSHKVLMARLKERLKRKNILKRRKMM